jgi:hypothetical protein
MDYFQHPQSPECRRFSEWGERQKNLSINHRGRFEMRFAISAALTVFSLMALIPEAGAIVCVHGVRGATCTAPIGAAAVRRPVHVCRWVAGRRVCR